MEVTPSSINRVLGNQPSLSNSPVGRQGGAEAVGKTFTEVLGALSQSENQSNALIQQLAAGEDVEIHQVMMAVEETDINFRIAMAIRDRLVEAYREVMRMSV
ncbi:flagellar hook-basal body complex protein FliE [Thermanaerothrix sp. 4228-RoL]|uniref:Flagellar hook-basal body complex protein FliE n=1 Tax=Thermanaerothrix solaris TaxID=3058434 RepID=A0ABU3NLH5_9CHLR|nr:flagellar hook-basal body complex protein FliE [Thermanaerothrix sp. 4228-RoL]MDT8897686.1 flagellar hook-basal body complex protein FliE [Thermanaerothrix sp. 4228-RoL]